MAAWLSRALVLAFAAGLSACAGSRPALVPSGEMARRGIECVPFARALTGVALHGDGPDWWQAAEGRYRRAQAPEVGAIMVFRRTPRLPRGHVSVVSRVVSPREIFVTHANWVHDLVTQDQPVADVSAANDWSVVRVWWEPNGQLGATNYPILGFILPSRRLDHAAIAAGTARAARVALNEIE